MGISQSVSGENIPNGSITNAKLANMAEATIKGRALGAGTGSPEDLTGSQVADILGAVGVFVINGKVATYADLPAAASHTNEIWLVTTTTGIIYINRKVAGFYTSNGATWTLTTPIDIDGYQTLVSPATNGNILTTDANGQSQDSGKAFSTDGTLSADSDNLSPTQKAVKTYADNVSSNASVIAKLLTGFTAGAGVVSASDSILSAFQKIVGNIAALVTGVSSVSGTTNRISVNQTTGDVEVDISASYEGQTSITTVGDIDNGTWNAGAVTSSGAVSSTSTTNALVSSVYTSGIGTDSARFLAETQSLAAASNAYYEVSSVGLAINWTWGIQNSSGNLIFSRSASLGTNNFLEFDKTNGKIIGGEWTATKIAEIYGGTNQTSYTLGDILYSSAANTLSKLSGNTTTTKKFLTQTGNGSASAAPGWNTIAATDLPSGSILQTPAPITKTSVFSTSSSTKVDWTGMTATVVTTTASSKIGIYFTGGVSSDNSNAFQYVYLFFNVNGGAYTQIALGDAASSAQRCWVDAATSGNTAYANQLKPLAGIFFHTHGQAAGSTLNYKLQVAVTNSGGTSYWGRTADLADANRSSIPSTLTLIEYA